MFLYNGLIMTLLEVATCCQIINIRERVSCLWVKTALFIWVLHQWGCFT